MAQLDNESNKLSPKQVEFIKSVLKKEGFEDAKVTYKSVGEAGDNYSAYIKRIVAEKDGKTFSMVAKVAPTVEQQRVAMYSHVVFRNEYVMYSEILAKFSAMEEVAGIPVSERLRYAKFYGGIIEDPIEMIFLEDLQVPGFVLLDRFKPLPDEAIKLVLKSFAKLHSRSYALKNQEPDTYNEFTKALANAWLYLTQEENKMESFKTLEEDAINFVTSDEHKAALRNTASNIKEIFHKLHKTDSESPYSVIQQGDSWTNNIMFKLEGTTPSECCMIDYQIARVNSPVADLHYMIFACTNYESRAKHFHSWINYYYSELDKNLSHFSLKSAQCYPRDQLDADLKRHGTLSLINVIILAPALTRESADAAQIKETVDVMDVLKVNTSASEESKTLIRNRIAGAIDSLLELGYI